MDRITFDFEESTITFESDKGQHGTEYVHNLKDMKEDILAAAGYETFSGADLIEEFKKRTGIDLSNLG